MPDSTTSGQVYLLEAGPRERELVFSFPVDEELNDAVKQLPGRWFDWRRKNWRVPAHPRVAKPVAEVLAETARDMDPQWPEAEEDLSAVVIPE